MLALKDSADRMNPPLENAPMAISRLKGKNVDVELWTRVTDMESVALDQLRRIAALPWVFHHVAAMPDVHYGKGATVGSVIAMKDAVAPAAVGVDIGCGMAAIRTNISASQLPDSLRSLRSDIESRVPVGFGSHREAVAGTGKLPLWDEFASLIPQVEGLKSKARLQMGTLGGGNHFIELCLDTEGQLWIMLHSGSRNIGKELAEIHISRAKKLAHNQNLPDRDLAVFLAGTPEMQTYRHDLFWAQRYARANREVMLELVIQAVREHFPAMTLDEPVHCHHNYVAEEIHYGEHVFVTRKGAIHAGKGVLGIIPGSMGTRSYIVRGLGNPASFESASHGAGRRMSRGEAKRRFSVKDVSIQTQGVECRKDSGVIDEIPGAYKPIEQVMEDQRDLVEIVAELKQVLCVKG
jgi:tRNA-splicing ligase RtcB